MDSLGRILARDHEAEAVREFVQILQPELLDELGILEWAYCNALSDERTDALERKIKESHGVDYFYLLQAACLFVTRIQLSSDYGKIAAAREFFSKYRDLHLAPFQLRGCKTLEQMEQVLSVQRRIAGGDLLGYYDEDGVQVLDVQGCSVRARRGMWEAVGGTELSLYDTGGRLVSVSGFFHWEGFQPETTIVCIQGTCGQQAAQRAIHDRLGLHPANVALLLFLQLSRLLEQKRVRIRGTASPDYNVEGQDSALYRIPRNHLRLKINQDSGLYDFDAGQRDGVLNKFAKRHPVIAEAFADLAVGMRTTHP
ncbi:hypothetical protein ACU8MG_25300 (plasmid) [Rhizobium leguminosarum]